MNASRGQINLEQQPLPDLYKLFRQRINMAEQIQRDLDGCKRDIVLINAVIQKKEEAEKIREDSEKGKELPAVGESSQGKVVKKKKGK